MQLFRRLDFPLHPTSFLAIRDHGLVAVPWDHAASDLPSNQAEIVSLLNLALALAERAFYNHGNALRLVQVAVRVHAVIMESGCGSSRSPHTCQQTPAMLTVITE